MGGIIIDGRAALRFKGSISDFARVADGLQKIEGKINGLKIDTIPLPESPGICIVMHFRGTVVEFESCLSGVDDKIGTLAIDTVPLPERIAIGTWPTPEFPSKHMSWIVEIATSRAKV